MASNMLRGLWPSGPADQTTPKASSSHSNGAERNPFDAMQPPAMTKQSSRSSLNSSIIGTHLPGDQTPGMRTPGGITSHSAIPTTSISLSDPDFTMKLPPPKQQKTDSPQAVTNSTAPVSDAPSTASAASTSNSAINSNATSSGTSKTRNTAAPRGHLTIKIVAGRNLAVSSPAARPYAVVQFDKNEFIGREPIDEFGEEAKGFAQPRSEAGEAGRSRAKTVTPADALSRTGQNHNPVWKHEVTFDVTQDSQPIYISVYDRHSEDEGFLGMREIKPRLVHKMMSDQWYHLSSRDDEEGMENHRGEIRVQISYERMPQKKLTPHDFEYLKLIGRGTFGRVFQVRKKDTKRIYAMKVLSKREIALKKEVTHTMGERKILEKSLDCPFLVGLKFSFQSATELYFVTDYKSGGELFWHLQREGRFTEERARFYIAELVLALEHLHKYDIVYRDLKPENILLDATGHVALCDFGLSKPDLGAGQLTNTFCGTTEYLAPEVLLDESGYSKLVDFWSLGVLLFEMCCGWSPFYAEDTQQMYRNICFGKIKFPRGAIGDDGKQFVKGLLNRNPRHRLGAQRDAQDLKEHPFFKDIDFDALAKKQLTPPFKPLVESDESVANFDPEFTETDLKDVAVIPGFEGSSTDAANALSNGDILSEKDANGKGVAINKGRGEEEDDHLLTKSVQDKFRGFSYSGTYEGSVAGSYGGRRGSGGFGLAGASLGMSRMGVNDDDAMDDEAAFEQLDTDEVMYTR
ncbi:probable SCH9 - serine/threonine protein kinase involved in stress response and nutrient-sensing signaling pathway [Ustilago trichophora]|uniref:Probable SCH9 - serine/threonine protein kinase involved in stress response and nutrient-sensing signaling pathway n=1 Tax=Ustilago trichophora TaxID=86804 RepID=A0A5C3DRY6_9BASI|nr:probable SCH9 - serine/threonine protein kinase involved in stress response and nutrient-sensing signaling pathway [Ustilago trichophora]